MTKPTTERWEPLSKRYGLPEGGDWTSWQAGRAWAREHEFYGIPAWCGKPYLLGFVMANAIAAPILLILLALGWPR